ncbi:MULTISPECIES: cation:proton antiporter [Vibrio]|uniref:Sodium:proton antiporter n=1 Tax=Vibrio casei TaxID=673372 RepID=A0A368LL25_9VIBR|nr:MULTISPECIES: sodium:proton antiporter [Vibrio]RCS72600.1 sodium:proton antiporter [Vibrio casei]SJN35732.1 NhaP-type Na+/H+ and K+/H+ antiporters [Vibrio casei]HBV74802.1 sodium:proton antiporter [Vibrio sp.]
MHEEQIGLMLAAVGLVGLGCQWLAWRMKLPAILFLLIAGFIIGPITHVFQPNEMFGELLFPLISLAVAVILFEGSLTLNFKEIREVNRTVINIVTIGALVTWALTSVFTFYILEFSWPLALLFGSLTVVTGPTVVVPLLRTVRPKSKLANILRWEGILIDPIGALFIVIVYEFIVSSSKIHSLEVFGLILLIGIVLGAVAGAFLAQILRRRLLPEYLQPFAVLTLVLGVFSISNALESESGLLAVTVMGMWLANAKDVNIKNILHFKENLTILLISGLFLMLSARMELSDFAALGVGSVVLFAVIQLVSRPVAVFLATIDSSLNMKEKFFIAWVAPRGIVAASISSLFAIKLVDAGVEEAALLVPLTFMVIVGTVVLQSITARPLANFLKVSEPSPRGYLIVGANDVGRMIALSLKKYGHRIVITDSNWEYIRKARMQGIETYYGNPISSHAEEYLDLIGIGNVIAVTPDKHFNIVVAKHFMSDFGERRVFFLNGRSKDSQHEKHRVVEDKHGRALFGDDVSYKKLASLVNQGAEVKHTKLSEEFTWADYVMKYVDGHRLSLFTIDPKGSIHIFSADSQHQTDKGWTVVSLIKE